jgi:magnesium-protoporphyrin O-methyltransferase
MNCQCDGIEAFFSRKMAEKELRHYQAKGATGVTRTLIADVTDGLQPASVLDIGGGVGVIQHELLKAGVGQVTSVEGSTGYASVAKEEAERLGHAERLGQIVGNFVDAAPNVEPADVVTLDKVICCFDDMEALVALSTERARLRLGLVYPRDNVILKLGFRILNLYPKFKGNPFRAFVHSSKRVDEIVRSKGLTLHSYRTTLIWQVAVYAR